MTSNVELLPLPPLHIAPSVEPVDYPDVAQALMDYARANVAHATAAKDAEIEALRAEVRRLWECAAGWSITAGKAVARAERLAEALRDAADDIDAGVPPEDAAAHLRARADLLRDQEERK